MYQAKFVTKTPTMRASHIIQGLFEQQYAPNYFKKYKQDPVQKYYSKQHYQDENISINKEKILISSPTQCHDEVVSSTGSSSDGETSEDNDENAVKTDINNDFTENDALSALNRKSVKKVKPKTKKKIVIHKEKKIPCLRKSITRKTGKKERNKDEKTSKKTFPMKTNTVKKKAKANINKIKKNIRKNKLILPKEPDVKIRYKKLKTKNTDNVFLKEVTSKKKKNFRRNLIHFGNYLRPTFATVLKQKQKYIPSALLEHIPFIVGQSPSKSHNLATKLQENRLYNRAFNTDLLLTKQQNYNNRGCGDQMNPTNCARKMIITIADNSQLNNGVPALINLPKGNNDKNIIKDVLQNLHTNFSKNMVHQEDLEMKIKNKTDCSQEMITEFKELCEKMEKDENIIRALLLLINEVHALNVRLAQSNKKKVKVKTFKF